MIPLGCSWNLCYNEMCGLPDGVSFFLSTVEYVWQLAAQTWKLEQMNTIPHNVNLSCDAFLWPVSHWLAVHPKVCIKKRSQCVKCNQKPHNVSRCWTNLKSIKNCPLVKEEAVKEINTLCFYLSCVENCKLIHLSIIVEFPNRHQKY